MVKNLTKIYSIFSLECYVTLSVAFPFFFFFFFFVQYIMVITLVSLLFTVRACVWGRVLLSEGPDIN